MKEKFIPTYVVFAVIKGIEGGFPLVQDNKDIKEEDRLFKLPGGKEELDDKGLPESTCLREVSNEETRIIICVPSKIVFKKPLIGKGGVKYNFIVMEADYYYGEIKVKEGGGLLKIKIFSRKEIEDMISKKMILPNHAEGLMEYFSQVDIKQEVVEAF